MPSLQIRSDQVLISRETVEHIDHALRASRDHALNHRYGGLGWLYRMCRDAIAELDQELAQNKQGAEQLSLDDLYSVKGE